MLQPPGLYTAAEMRAVEAQTLAMLGVDESVLMERAGGAAFAFLRERWPRARRLVVVCGPGNNGGDGYVLARLAHIATLAVSVLELESERPRPPAAAAARAALLAAGLTPERFRSDALAEADVIVDALLGIGCARAPEGPLAAAIEAINRFPSEVLAIDLPSGLDADTGATPGVAVRATATVSLIAWKRGLFTAEGPDHAGERVLRGLDVPAGAYTVDDAVTHLDARACLAPFGRRRRAAHKGDHGHLVIVGGDHGYAGAPRLAAEAALRCGAGLVTVATREAHVAAQAAALPEAMWRDVADGAALAPLLERADAVVIGPGLGQGTWGRGLLDAALASGVPAVLDADALNLLAGSTHTAQDWILTPHPGEAGRLLGSDARRVQADRFAAARALCDRYRGVVVLKGAGTLIADRDGLALCSAGNPGLAVAGMGDLLAGVIGALRVQGQGAVTAARCGVWLHAMAGDAAARAGERGLLPRDLLPELRRLVNP